jgi:ribosome-binding protein aMBF1 (putative translation factor)
MADSPWSLGFDDDENRLTAYHRNHVLWNNKEQGTWKAFKKGDLVHIIARDYDDLIRQINEREGVENSKLSEIKHLPEFPQ